MRAEGARVEVGWGKVVITYRNKAPLTVGAQLRETCVDKNVSKMAG